MEKGKRFLHALRLVEMTAKSHRLVEMTAKSHRLVEMTGKSRRLIEMTGKSRCLVEMKDKCHVEHRRDILRIVILLLAAAFIIFGVSRGEVGIVLKKAVRICMECIGLG